MSSIEFRSRGILGQMFTRRPVFAQILTSLDPREFARCAERFPMSKPPRGYLDFPRLGRWQQEGAYFVVRSLSKISFGVLKSSPVNKSTGLRCDQLIGLKRFQSRRAYPHTLRRIRIHDPEHNQHIVLLTNDLRLAAETISLLYAKRWQVELFFKWVKQHLRLAVFLGRSDNAVRSQVWAAVCAYLLVMIAKKEWAITQSLHRILQTVSISPFEQVPLQELLMEMDKDSNPADSPNQLLLKIL